jgi:hypothetical protein
MGSSDAPAAVNTTGDRSTSRVPACASSFLIRWLNAGTDLAQIRAAYETAWNGANAARHDLAAFPALASALVQPRRTRPGGRALWNERGVVV